MSININAIGACRDIPECMRAEEMWLATPDDEHIGVLSNLHYAWFVISEVQTLKRSTAILVIQR